MPEFGSRSRLRLESCHYDLYYLFSEVVKTYDCSVLCGHRGQLEQTQAFDSKRSKVQWPDSKHNSIPSRAIDIVPFPINWGDTGSEKERRKALARFYHFAGYVKAVADQLGIKVRWGGDWDGDGLFNDQNFDDLPHWELI